MSGPATKTVVSDLEGCTAIFEALSTRRWSRTTCTADEFSLVIERGETRGC